MVPWCPLANENKLTVKTNCVTVRNKTLALRYAVQKIAIKATNNGRFNVHATVSTLQHNINEICAYFRP